MNAKRGNFKDYSPKSFDFSAVVRLRSWPAFLAVLAMLLAGPVHLWLGHTHEHHEVVPSETHTVVHQHAACQHHDHCGPHFTDHHVFPADCQESSPCDHHSEDCDTCTVLASFTPLHFSFVTLVTEMEFLDYVHPDRATPYVMSSGRRHIARGPPARI